MNRGLVLASLLLFAVTSIVLALFTGGTGIPPAEVLRALLFPSEDGVAHTLIWELRLPRALTAGIVGASLAVCGVVFQAILRNPLAEPYTLGVSGGGALGAVVAILLGLGGLPMALLCFLGCCLSIGIVLGAAYARNFTNSMLILSGVIMSFIFSSAVMFIFAVASSREVHASILWLMGSLSAPPEGSMAMLLTVFPLVPGFILFAKDLNLLSLGDESSYHLGLDARKSKTLLLLAASLVTGVCVAVSGVIAFIGLVIPHLTRKLAGADHHVLLPASVLAGAGFLILSDSIAQVVIRPLELPVGVITGMVGGVFFLLYLLKARPEEVI
ncbi:MAG TPA: iron ABC transporter permease [Deltaproteobacteria bacterium]|nr:iron ABC transporter permease [Deltaproteobacteria bacterium]HOI05784.1 iron ABC transporter permease [Deltaproteobacteria bacterium]